MNQKNKEVIVIVPIYENNLDPLLKTETIGCEDGSCDRQFKPFKRETINKKYDIGNPPAYLYGEEQFKSPYYNRGVTPSNKPTLEGLRSTYHSQHEPLTGIQFTMPWEDYYTEDEYQLRYKKPVQPYIYREEEEELLPDPNTFGTIIQPKKSYVDAYKNVDKKKLHKQKQKKNNQSHGINLMTSVKNICR